MASFNLFLVIVDCLQQQLPNSAVNGMQVRYKLKDYHKEASDQYLKQVASRGQYLSVGGSEENSFQRSKAIHDIFAPLSDTYTSEPDPICSAQLAESLRLYEEKLQFGLEDQSIKPFNHEEASLKCFQEPIIREMEFVELKDDIAILSTSNRLIAPFLNDLKPIHIHTEFPSFTESDIYGDMLHKPPVVENAPPVATLLKFDNDMSLSISFFEYPEWDNGGYKNEICTVVTSFTPILKPDPLDLERYYAGYMSSVQVPEDDNMLQDTGHTSYLNETQLLGGPQESSNLVDYEVSESFERIRPVDLIAKFNFKELISPADAYATHEHKAIERLNEFETKIWDDESAFRDPTIKPLKVPSFDDSIRSISTRDIVQKVDFALKSTMNLELDLKSYWQQDSLEAYRKATEFDRLEFKVMDVDNDASLDVNERFEVNRNTRSDDLIGDEADVSYVEFQLNAIKEENIDEDSRFLKSLQAKTNSCIDYNDNCKGLIYNYISMVESLPAVTLFSQFMDTMDGGARTKDTAHAHEMIARCDTSSGHATPLATSTPTMPVSFNSPNTKASQLPALNPSNSTPSTIRPNTSKRAQTASLLEEDPLLEYMKLRGLSIESTLPKNIWDRKFRMKSPPDSAYDDYKVNLAEAIRLSGHCALLGPKSISLTHVMLYVCYNIVSVIKAPVVWLCNDENQCNAVIALAKPIFSESVHLVSKGFAAPNVKPGESALLIVNEPAVQGAVMKKSVLQQLSTAHLLFLDDTIAWDQSAQTAKEFIKHLPASARVISLSSQVPSSFQVFAQVLRELKIEAIISVLKTDPDVKNSTCVAEKLFVPLSDEIFRILDVVSAFQQELISQIKETSVIELPEDSVLLSATQTKSLIDQLSQTIKDVPRSQSEGMSALLVNLMKLIVCAYVLAKADDYLVHYGVLSAVHGLATAMQHPKYGHTLQEMLKDLYEELLRCQEEIDAGLYQSHPKINLFTRLINEATANPKNKCLIVIEHEQLGREIVDSLNRAESHTKVATLSENFNQGQLNELVNGNEALIVSVGSLVKQAEFPYSYFAWVIEYEDYGLDISDKVNRATRHVKLIASHDETVHQNEANERLVEAWIKKLRTALRPNDSKLSQLRVMNVSDYVNGKANWPQSLFIAGLELSDLDTAAPTADMMVLERPESPTSLIPIKLIIGERLLQQREFLKELQDQQRIELIERTLAFNEDIIVDDKTCVVIRKLTALPNLVNQPTNATDQSGKEKEKRKLLIELIKLALKYPSIWLLIDVDDDISQPQYQTALQEIQLWSLYLSNETQVRYAFSLAHLAQLVRRVCHHCAQSSLEWDGSLELWASRKWLLDDESKHELFLAKFPSMNPFRAQIILTLIELKEALGMSLADLKAKFRWITPSSLEYLDYALSFTKVAAIQQTYPSPNTSQTKNYSAGSGVPSRDKFLRAPANKLKRPYDSGTIDVDERNSVKRRKTKYVY